MKTDLNQNEIDELEQVLYNFSEEFEEIQNHRSTKWRSHFFIAFIIAIGVMFLAPTFWWVSLVVIAYFAGSLFTLLRQNAKTSSEINEHRMQLKLARFLLNFKESSYAEKQRMTTD